MKNKPQLKYWRSLSEKKKKKWETKQIIFKLIN